ncbi:pyridoxal phosphate-dependent aminotransferase [Aliihoeflea aestuarii]|jgi:histidinol-phosphate aminotransferase|uniref:pyridoxal phosphate-dependent aminotransferase n=1 Tax=Aliihoeflea aestuarii TaxID=453840 RepID=UPI0020924D90|nr:pyridoxal phosphate-dependent aminotransferase [Aliihoeflea aestuarii]MCO6389462.1 pyridoxal phosphate-dependent aminotransferase [Aliihoeflea aestuarii]
MNRPHLTPLAESLPATVPFVGPEAQERQRGRPFRARLGANESGFGPSPKVQAAIAAAAGGMWMYGDPESADLRAKLSHKLGVAPQNIVIGEGIDALLGLIVRLWAGSGQPVVTSLGAYPTFNYHVAGFGARLVTVPYEDDRESLVALLDAVKRENAPLVYLANPDNPMGTWWPADEVERFIDALPETTMLVLDEAYGETAPHGTLLPLDVTRPNVLRMRTFSKAYGLAGLRCGYAIGEARTINAFEKVRNHFGMTRMAQVAALAALDDEPYLQSVIADVAACRDRLSSIAAANGFSAIPSATNFVTIDCKSDGAFAMKVMQELIAREIFVRKPMAPVLDRCIRVSVGPAAEIDLFEAELPKALAAARG